MHLPSFHLRIFLELVSIFQVNSQLATWSTIYESPMTKEPQTGWVRFCKESGTYDVFANQCPAGIFWEGSNDTNWDCICTRGPWRRSSGWCSNEDTQRFTQGGTTCFKLDDNEKEGLKGMYYLGDQFSAWDSNTPILLTDYKTGIPIRQGEWRTDWEVPSRTGKEPGIVIYRPRDDWAVYNKHANSSKLCLKAPDNFDDDSEGLFIYNVSQLFDGDTKMLKLTFTRGCFSWKEDDEVEWQDVVGENLFKKNMIVPGFNPKTAPEECIKCMTRPIPATPTTDIDGEPLDERDDFTIYDLKNVAVLKTEVDLQTERLGHYWAHRMLQNGSDYISGNFQELEILTKAAILALNTCDRNYVPFEFYQYFLIMFRMLLSESFKKYPPKSPIGDEYYAKINEMLDKCNKRKLDIKFNMSETCPSLFESFSVNGTETYSVNLTSDYTSLKGRHDFLLEFIWRLKSFMHYKCFEEFQTNSILHDVVQHQLESLFTEDLVLRWYNPGNSFQMYKLIFESHFDLDVVMKNFQRCVIAAHDLSQYPVWLKRPIDRPEIKPRKGSGVGRKKRSTRRRRDAEGDNEYDEDDDDEPTPPYNLFTGSAACIKSMRTFIKEAKLEAESKCW